MSHQWIPMRNEFREAALAELLPRAFIKRARTSAYLDGRMLVVDTEVLRFVE